MKRKARLTDLLVVFAFSTGLITTVYGIGTANTLFELGFIPLWLTLVSYACGMASLYASLTIIERFLRGEYHG